MTCAWEGCDKARSGKSKYCATHKREARDRWRDMVSEKSAERDEKRKEFHRVFVAAHSAGVRAAEAHEPTPMVVYEPRDVMASLMGNDKGIEDARKVYAPIESGVCGFAWITIRPGTSSAARYAVKEHGFRKAYYGGVEKWVSGFGQSMERKEAYARAYADVLREAGIGASAGSRMD